MPWSAKGKWLSSCAFRHIDSLWTCETWSLNANTLKDHTFVNYKNDWLILGCNKVFQRRYKNLDGKRNDWYEHYWDSSIPAERNSKEGRGKETGRFFRIQKSKIKLWICQRKCIMIYDLIWRPNDKTSNREWSKTDRGSLEAILWFAINESCKSW